MVLGLFAEALELGLEDEALVVEGEHVGRGDGDLEDGHFEDALAEAGGREAAQLLLYAAVDVGLEGGLPDALLPQSRQVELAQQELLLLAQLAAAAFVQFAQLLYLAQSRDVLVAQVLRLAPLPRLRSRQRDLIEDEVDFQDFSDHALDGWVVVAEEFLGRPLADMLQGLQLHYLPELLQHGRMLLRVRRVRLERRNHLEEYVHQVYQLEVVFVDQIASRGTAQHLHFPQAAVRQFLYDRVHETDEKGQVLLIDAETHDDSGEVM